VGAAMGMGAGALLGGIRDAFDIGFRSNFLEAILIKLRGDVIRQWRSDFEDEQIDKVVNEQQEALAQSERRTRSRGYRAKNTLNKRVDEARAKLDEAGKRAEARQRQLQKEAEAERKNSSNSLQGQPEKQRPG